jgi:hypothetical protein
VVREAVVQEFPIVAESFMMARKDNYTRSARRQPVRIVMDHAVISIPPAGCLAFAYQVRPGSLPNATMRGAARWRSALAWR